jgi:hypothetical protein
LGSPLSRVRQVGKLLARTNDPKFLLADFREDFARLENLESAILATIDFLAAEQHEALNSSEFGSLQLDNDISLTFVVNRIKVIRFIVGGHVYPPHRSRNNLSQNLFSARAGLKAPQSLCLSASR